MLQVPAAHQQAKDERLSSRTPWYQKIPTWTALSPINVTQRFASCHSGSVYMNSGAAETILKSCDLACMHTPAEKERAETGMGGSCVFGILETLEIFIFWRSKNFMLKGKFNKSMSSFVR